MEAVADYLSGSVKARIPCPGSYQLHQQSKWTTDHCAGQSTSYNLITSL